VYPCDQLPKPSSSNSVFIATKPKAIENICTATVVKPGYGRPTSALRKVFIQLNISRTGSVTLM
jgi:hypothetical protein